MQFLSRRSCNFKIARVNRLRFQRDFSAIIAAISQEFRTCSKLDTILRRFFDKIESQGTPREVLSRRISVCFCMVMASLRADVSYFLCFPREAKEIGDVCTQARLWLIRTKNLHSSMSSSSPNTGNNISDTQTGSSNSEVFLDIHAYLPVHFPSC